MSPPPPAPPPAAPWYQRTWGQALVILAIAAAYLGYLQYQSPFIADTDGYFHIKVAQLIWKRGVLHEFPWAQFSLWHDHYFDKEWLFHVLLAPLAGVDMVMGAKVGAVIFGVLVFVSFYMVLRWTGIQLAWFWTLVLLLGSGGYFGWRVSVTRPQVLSITLSLWAMYFVLREAPRRLFATSAVYALSYTAPHVAIGYAVVNLGARRALDRRWAWKLPLAAVVGVATGWLLHPHRRAALLAVKTQTVDVLLNKYVASSVGTPDLHLGGELGPAPWDIFLREHAGILIACAVAAFVWWRLRPKLGSRFFTLAVITLGFLVLTLQSKRFVEYWAPFTVWTCAWVTRDVQERWREVVPWASSGWRREVAWCALVAGVVFLFGRVFFENRRNSRGPRASNAQVAAAWLHDHAPPGDIVFTCDWDDGPELLFYDDTHRYLVFLDPTFMYQWRPEIWRTWDAVTHGMSRPADVIRDTFHSRYVFCTSDFGGFIDEMKADPRVAMTLHTRDVSVFQIFDGVAPESAKVKPEPPPEQARSAAKPAPQLGPGPGPGPRAEAQAGAAQPAP